jgi:TonB-linked SusC/RagA family outer membrane protein
MGVIRNLQKNSKTKQSVTRFQIVLLLMMFVGTFSYAQTTITGTVTDVTTGEGLISANVYLKSNLSRGTITDFDGNYTIEVPKDAKTLVFSYIGYGLKEVPINGRTAVDVTMSESIDIQEVVVTGLSISRDKKSLGYAVQELDGKEVSEVKTTNISNALAGKVAGVFITGSGNGPTASANVTIRGESSLSGKSQALFVVNGIPITNGLYSPGDGLNGSTTIDFGNASQVINSDDIASISILKGPAASALYGSRAANGVILVTTKTGTNNSEKGWQVSLNSTTNFETILKLPDFQNEYGVGGYGKYSYNDGVTYTGNNYDAFGENWGPRLDGTPIKQWNSDEAAVPFVAAPNNIRDFFQTGITASNNVSIANSSETGDFRLSYTNLSRQGVVPNTNLTRNTLYASMGQRLMNDKLNIRVNAMYVRSGSDNVPNAGYDESSSIMYGWLWYPRQVSIDDMQQYWKPGQEGVQQRYSEELWVNNPWLIVNENTNSFQENRIIGNANISYNFTPNFSFRYRFGADVKDEQRQYRRAPSTKAVLNGSYREDELSFMETNNEFLLSWNTDRLNGSKLQVDLKGGANIMRQNSNFLIANNPQLLLHGTDPSIYSLTNNRSNVLVENPRALKGINSVFALATLAYDNFLYLDLTGRNDVSSTLPTANNSYFYPSASLSAVISEKLNLSVNSPLSFLKARLAYAEVGNDTDPYLLSNYYTPEALFGSNSAFGVNSLAGNGDLRPERTTSFEVGVDVRFFKNRLRLDATYYSMLSKDQIILLPVAATSGKNTRLANAGEISNKGIEVALSATAIRRQNGLNWDITLNLGHNRAIVESLPEGVKDNYPMVANLYPNDGGTAGLDLVAVEGELLGQLRGLTFVRDENDNIVHKNGLPVTSEEKSIVGSYQPYLRAGVYNTFTYKNLSFGFLFDGSFGGKIFSRTHALMNTAGGITNNDDPNLPMSSLDGREIYDISYDVNGSPVYDLVDAGGVVGPGVDIDGGENTTVVSPRDYFYAYYGNGFRRDNIESALFDATYVKLREVRIAYQFKSEALGNLGFEGLSVALVGRNLLLFTDVPSIDPETYSIRNGRFVNGFESTQLPSTRSFGISISATF